MPDNDNQFVGQITGNYSVDLNNFPSNTFNWSNLTSAATIQPSNYSTVGSGMLSGGTYSPNPDLYVNGDIKIKGVSLKDTLDTINERLLILQPDPAKLEKYEALRIAYEHYKLMEKLINDE